LKEINVARKPTKEKSRRPDFHFPKKPKKNTALCTRVLFYGCKIRRENLWLVYLQPTTNHRFSLRILQPEKRTLLCTHLEWPVEVLAKQRKLFGSALWSLGCPWLCELVDPI
jgi:hypothetical protein